MSGVTLQITIIIINCCQTHKCYYVLSINPAHTDLRWIDIVGLRCYYEHIPVSGSHNDGCRVSAVYVTRQIVIISDWFSPITAADHVTIIAGSTLHSVNTLPALSFPLGSFWASLDDRIMRGGWWSIETSFTDSFSVNPFLGDRGGARGVNCPRPLSPLYLQDHKIC